MVTVAPLDAGSHVEWAGFLDDLPVFLTAEGEAVVIEGGERRDSLHDGLLAAALARDGSFIATAGEDGSIRRFSPSKGLCDAGNTAGKWVNALACGPDGMVAAAHGKSVTLFSRSSDEPRTFETDRSVEAVAFAPKGARLALARYNGVELIWFNSPAKPQFLEWKGAHIGVTFSPDGRYVVTAMQENALHGWRLADSRHMRMSGYPAKVKSLSWSPKGKWLASTGAPAAITWPFSGKDGPMGKPPKELGSMGQVLTTQVVFHPGEDVVAIGYANGMVAAVKVEDSADAVLRQPGESAVSALGWSRDGKRLAFGCENGEAGIIDISNS